MINIDMRTAFVGNFIISFVCFTVILIAWLQYRKTYKGITQWIIYSALLLVGTVLIALRGMIPILVSVVVANGFIIGGLIILIFGLLTFAGKEVSELKYFFAIFFTAYISVHSYYTFVHDNLLARSYNSVIGLTLVALCGAAVIHFAVKPPVRRIYGGVIISLVISGLINVVRVIGFYFSPTTGNDFMQTGPLDSLLVALLGGVNALIAFSMLFLLTSRQNIDQRNTEKELRENQSRLQESEANYRLLFENSMDGVFLTVPDGGILKVNQAACSMFQRTEEEILRLSRPFFIDVSDQRSALAEDERRRTGRFDGELTGIRADGTRFPIHVSSVVFKDAGGNERMSVIVRDQYKIKEMEKERQKINEQLVVQDRLASIGQLVSGVAHELNNPLTSVLGFSELLLQRELPENIKGDLKIINSEAQRTALIVKKLLTFARQQAEEKGMCDLNRLIQEVIALRRHEESLHNIAVLERFSSRLPPVRGNGSQLQQVFFNLIINAEQAMTEAHDRGTLTITTESTGDVVRAMISDDGPGIAPENMARLFTPFFTTKEIGKGTGLGLSIGHGIISEHGGTIKARSEYGKGATFIVELPVGTPELD